MDLKSETATKSPIKTAKIVSTLIMYYTEFVIGLCSGIHGPTFFHMAKLFETDTSTLSTVFLCYNVAYFCGAFLSGRLYDRYKANLQNSIVIFILAAAFYLAPRGSCKETFYVCVALMGLCQGYVISSNAGRIFRLWEDTKYKAPLLQCCAVFSAVGSFVTQYIALPFLVPIPIECRSSVAGQSIDIDTENSENNSYIIAPNGTTETGMDVPEYDICAEIDVSPVKHAYSIVGAAVLLCSLVSFALYLCSNPSFNCTETSPKKDTISDTKDSAYIEEGKCFRNSLLWIAIVMYFFAEMSRYLPGVYLSSFVIEWLNWPVNFGPLMTSVLVGCAGLGRILGVPLTYFLPARVILIILITIFSIGFSMFLLVEQLPIHLMYLSIALIGLGSSSMYTCIILFLGQYVFINSSICSLFLMSASASGFVGAFTVGKLIDFNYMWFVYICNICSCVCVVLFIVMNVLIVCCYKENSVPGVVPNTEKGTDDLLLPKQNIPIQTNEKLLVFCSTVSLA